MKKFSTPKCLDLSTLSLSFKVSAWFFVALSILGKYCSLEHEFHQYLDLSLSSRLWSWSDATMNLIRTLPSPAYCRSIYIHSALSLGIFLYCWKLNLISLYPITIFSTVLLFISKTLFHLYKLLKQFQCCFWERFCPSNRTF